ncbi:hypothetical protein GCM10010910_04080 [Microbacterium nanhaiense]|uniref:Transposase n=1 Tax=Microbacterium nanhaiense TaxID=1301026 RepID=A0ABQ2MYB4_9MICO|nr:hypothetical protein GCM10010910_04080 [Microbacterium nanhaiense]
MISGARASVITVTINEADDSTAVRANLHRTRLALERAHSPKIGTRGALGRYLGCSPREARPPRAPYRYLSTSVDREGYGNNLARADLHAKSLTTLAVAVAHLKGRPAVWSAY